MSKKFDKNLKERFINTRNFLTMISISSVYSSKKVFSLMNIWEKFNQTALPRKEDFYSYLNMEDITDAEYMHTKRVCKDFEINNVAQYHEVFVQSETLLLADVFENFRNFCREIYELNPACFLAALGLEKH